MGRSRGSVDDPPASYRLFRRQTDLSGHCIQGDDGCLTLTHAHLFSPRRNPRLFSRNLKDMPTKRKLRITPQALLDLKVPSDLRISPSGARVAYTVEETDWEENDTAQHLYVIDAELNKDPRQLTRGKTQEFGLEWSPSGDWLAFFRLPPADDDEDEDEESGEGKAQVWLLPMDGLGGEAEKLTDAPQGILAYEWLPDSSGIVYLAREPRAKPLQQAYEDRIEDEEDAVVDREETFRRQIWTIDLEKRKAAIVHRGDLGILEIAVSPDAERVAFLTNYTGELNDYHKADIWLLERGSGRIRPIAQGEGGKYQLHWSPDGEHLYFIQPQEPEYSYSQSNPLLRLPSWRRARQCDGGVRSRPRRLARLLVGSGRPLVFERRRGRRDGGVRSGGRRVRSLDSKRRAHPRVHRVAPAARSRMSRAATWTPPRCIGWRRTPKRRSC